MNQGDNRSTSVSPVETLVLTVALVALLVLRLWAEGNSVDFVAYNGDWQNYNPVRRLLAGQQYGRDFIDYLGVGHLGAGSLMTPLLGGSFAASKKAFELLTLVSSASLVALLARCITGAWRKAVWVTIALLGADMLLHVCGGAMLKPGASAKLLRVFGCCDIMLCLLLAGNWLWQRFRSETAFRFGAAFFGVTLGALPYWSNDGGVACALSAAFLWFLLCVTRRRRPVARVVYVLGVALLSVVSLLVCGWVISHGQLADLYNHTRAAGGDQVWYYPSWSKSSYIYEIDWLYTVWLLIPLGLTLYRSSRGGVTETTLVRSAAVLLVGLTLLVSLNMYTWVSGAYNRSAALVFLAAWGLSELAVVAERVDGLRRVMYKSAAPLCLVVLSACVALTYVMRQQNAEKTFVPALGGFARPELAEALETTGKKIAGKTYWGMFAGAHELLRGEYHPSGTDYVIHVLGEEAREHYCTSFLQMQPEVVSLPLASGFQAWLELGNWYVFRHVYRDYDLSDSDCIWKYWERRRESASYVYRDGTRVEVSPAGDGGVLLSVVCNRPVSGMADVAAEVLLEKTAAPTARLLSHRIVRVSIPSESEFGEKGYIFNLPGEWRGWLPVPVIKGRGYLLLRPWAHPRDVQLTVAPADQECDVLLKPAVHWMMNPAEVSPVDAKCCKLSVEMLWWGAVAEGHEVTLRFGETEIRGVTVARHEKKWELCVPCAAEEMQNLLRCHPVAELILPEEEN